MFLLVESGTLYILITVSSTIGTQSRARHQVFFSLQASILASVVIRVPFGTVGDIATPVGVQLAVRTPLLRLSPKDCVDSVNLTLREFIQLLCS